MRYVLFCFAVTLTTAFAMADDAPLKRYPIPARCIQAETGRCYIANWDFGEEVASTNPENELAGLPEIPFTPKRHVEVIRGAHHEYSLRLGGILDYENSHTRFNTGFTIAFQPNVSLSIANTGDRPVVWPKLIANGVRDWSTYDNLLADFTRGAATDQERALFIWQAARENRYHCSPLFPDNEFHDPVKIFNSYGLNLCDDMGYCGCSLFKHAGLGKPKYALDPKVRCLNGHMMCEAVVDDRHQFIDIDESVFYLDRENQRPTSGDACARDHDLVRREVHYGPTFGGWEGSESSAAIFGNDDRTTQLFLRGHEMRYTLRPGERVVFRWDNIGKYACHSEKWDHQPPLFGNSKFIYTPRIEDGAAAGTLVYAVDTPWAICGGTLRAEFASVAQPPSAVSAGSAQPGAAVLHSQAATKFALDVRLDGKKATRVWESDGHGPFKATVTIDDALQPRRAPAKYRYEVIATIPPGGAKLKSLEIETDVMAAPLSLPRLRLGDNKFVYCDKQEGPHEITITQEWRECGTLQPPLPPAAPEYPGDGATVRDSLVTFKWPATDGARAWHIQVSRREDFRIPYRPSYDVVIRERQWCVPYTGMFAPDATYYWRVRARDRRGIWSAWSPAWTFRWEGPRTPLDVRIEPREEGMLLRWGPNPRGTRPVAYDVYGSDEKGFSVHKEAYVSYARGRVPGNFLARTTDTALLVISPAPSQANMNRCYYRVVAVDAGGAESICSDFAETPHPHFWSAPPATASVGVPFSYRPGVIRSLGDAQHRYAPKGDGFWESEELAYSLREAPAWLKLDAKTGTLAGTPDAPGKHPIELEVRTQFGGSAVQRFDLTVAHRKP